MASKKGVSTSLAEVKGKKQACEECRKRKKRCGHRDDLSPASEANVPPASAADAADVSPAAVPVDNPVDDNNTTAMSLEPTLEGDQGRNPNTSASSVEIPVAAAPRAAAVIPSARVQTQNRVSKPRRPKAPIPSASNNLEGAITLATTNSFAERLAEALEEFEAKYQASMIAHKAVLEAGKAVKQAVDSWKESWAAGQ